MQKSLTKEISRPQRVNNQKNTIKFEGGFWGYVDIDSTKFNLNVGQQTIELDRPLKNIVFFFFDNHGSYVPLKYNIKDPFTNHLQVKVRGLKTNLVLKNQKFIKTKNGLKYIDKPWVMKKTSLKNKQW